MAEKNGAGHNPAANEWTWMGAAKRLRVRAFTGCWVPRRLEIYPERERRLRVSKTSTVFLAL
jgi:hypothetical protein